MKQVLRMLSAWAISMVAYPILVVFAMRATGASDSGFQEALLGVSLVTAIPGFAFALLVGVPTMSALVKLRRLGWLIVPAAGALFGLLMWMLTALIFPDGWRGAAYALTGYAAVLGTVWGSLNVLRGRMT